MIYLKNKTDINPHFEPDHECKPMWTKDLDKGLDKGVGKDLG